MEKDIRILVHMHMTSYSPSRAELSYKKQACYYWITPSFKRQSQA
jgi:hypothetical protein